MELAPMLILASNSPRRRELLARHGIDFAVETVPVEEKKTGMDGAELALENACRKAEAVAALHPGEFVLGADTVVLCGDRILGKPSSEEDAFAMLRFLSGKVHRVVTGVALICREKNISEHFTDETEVVFRQLDDSMIRRYISAVQVLDKAGAYALQEHGDWIIEKVTGDPDNVIGLPASRVVKWLKGAGCA